jgi:protein phosphatase
MYRDPEDLTLTDAGLPRITRLDVTAPAAAAPTLPALAFTAALHSDTGPVRPDNEDCARCVIGDRAAGGVDRVLLLVADGMGGHQGGEVASRLCVDGLAGAFRAGAALAPARLLDTALQAANRAVREAAAARPALQGMGTTMSALLVERGRFVAANVGDSRLYLLRGGRLRPLSVDDTLVNAWAREGRLSAAAARHHPDRNLLTRALGSADTLDGDVVCAQGVVLPGDRFLLCSDGLHDVVPDDTLARLLAAGEPHAVVRALVDAALCAGSTDNVTAAVLAVTAADAAASTPDDLRRTRPDLRRA